MDGIRTANLGLRFALELALLAGVAWWGWHVEGWLPAVALPIAFAAVWGTFLSPKARVPLARPPRLALELAVFALAALAWYGAGHGWVAVAFAGAVAASELVTWTAPR